MGVPAYSVDNSLPKHKLALIQNYQDQLFDEDPAYRVQGATGLGNLASILADAQKPDTAKVIETKHSAFGRSHHDLTHTHTAGFKPWTDP